MDYIEAFKNLRTNNKYGRKSPHKAILMLTVIELYEQNILTDNEIFYDEKLKSMFLKVWNRVLPHEPLFHPDAYLPFWYLQSDSFWHIIPIRGQEDILSLMRDTNIKPSEAKLRDSVRCAELDEDLYFLMTLSSGRTSLKRTLLETYTTLSNEQIEKFSSSVDNVIDYSTSAQNEYEKILSNDRSVSVIDHSEVNDETLMQFNNLDEDLRIIINFEYYSFLKEHKNEREIFKEICPTVYDLYHNIVNHPIKQQELSPVLARIYDNFLSDLKISLMSEDNSMELIDKISSAINLLRGNTEDEIEVVSTAGDSDKEKAPDSSKEELLEFEQEPSYDDLEIEHVYLDSHGKVIDTPPSINVEPKNEFVVEDRKGKPWTSNEEELITLYYKKGLDFSEIASKLGRTEVSIKSRLAKLGLIEYVYGQDESSTFKSVEENPKETDFTIENSFVRCFILNKNGEKVYSAEGKMKYINGKLYRLNLKNECFTVKRMEYNGGVWMKGTKKIVAYPKSKLYRVIDSALNSCEIVQDIEDSAVFEECRLKVNGLWYNYDGTIFEPNEDREKEIEIEKEDDAKSNDYPGFSVKIGDTLKVFPSQIIGTVTNLRVDRWGYKIIIVKSDKGELVSVYDSKYLYQKIYKKEDKPSPEKQNTRIYGDEMRVSPIYDSKVRNGSWIQWKPTGTVGRVVGFKSVGSVQKIVLRRKDGTEIEVYDNPKAYDIIKR